MAFNILVVDDSDVIRAMIGRTLRLAQVPVGTLYEASNGKEALSVLSESWIDLVLADINMPVMNGEEMIERMRLSPDIADVPVVVVSTEGATERVDSMMAAGVAAWVRKPFTPEEIRDVIARVTSTWPPTEEQHAHLDAVIGPVLETFAYVFPEAVSRDEVTDPGEEIVSATITFSGAASGTMMLCAPSDLCVELAANILGLDAADADAHLRGADTLGEVANITAGHLATRIEPSRQTDLYPPVVQRMDRAEWTRMSASAGTRAYVVEDRPFLVSLGLRPAKAS